MEKAAEESGTHISSTTTPMKTFLSTLAFLSPKWQHQDHLRELQEERRYVKCLEEFLDSNTL